jgi:predicted acetyltransferase
MTWREATLEDCSLLGALNHQLIADENHRNTMDVAALTERMRGFLRGDYTAVLFEDNSEVIAYALYHPYEQTELYLRQFFVARACRRKGVGREAIALLFDEAFPPEKRVIVTALSANEPAIAFWSAVGFDQYCISFERLPQTDGSLTRQTRNHE